MTTTHTTARVSGKQAAFLAAFARNCNITLSAEIAGIERGSHYYWLKNDAEYPAKFHDAQDAGIDRLAFSARERAERGLVKKMFHLGEPVIDPETGGQYFERSYSDVLTMFLLKAHRPEVYRDRVDHQITGPGGGPVETKATLTVGGILASPEAMAAAAALLRAVGTPTPDNRV